MGSREWGAVFASLQTKTDPSTRLLTNPAIYAILYEAGKIMNKLFRIVFLLSFPIMILYANESDMKITLESGASSNLVTTEIKHTVIYQGSASPELLGLIKKAIPAIYPGIIENAFVFEGRYIVEFFDGGKEKKYIIINNYWIYDEQEKIILRCSILSNLRWYLINYIRRD